MMMFIISADDRKGEVRSAMLEAIKWWYLPNRNDHDGL